MKLARVVGTVVSTISAPVFDGRTLLLCDLVDPEGRPAGGYMIAVDTVGAGVGETVLLLDEGNGARQVLRADPNAPVRTLVVGIVDAVTDDSPADDAPAPATVASSAPAPAKRKAPNRTPPRTRTAKPRARRAD
jgi:ethanolamine utilization protein EutN